MIPRKDFLSYISRIVQPQPKHLPHFISYRNYPSSIQPTNHISQHSSDTSGFVDVFYMYFYAFNYGTFLSLTNDSDPSIIDPFPIGNHVGDWEHNMIRFVNGTPQAVWYSQHDNGEAFTYDCLEKEGLRPITYSANGSHANYAINGTHSHGIPDINLPVGPVIDNTDVSVDPGNYLLKRLPLLRPGTKIYISRTDPSGTPPSPPTSTPTPPPTRLLRPSLHP